MLDHQALQSGPLYEAAADRYRAMSYVPVLDIGRPARDRLARSRRWTSIARFRRSMYLRGEHREIVCLCGPSIGPGPLSVRCALPEVIDWRRLDIGSTETAEVEGESIHFGKLVRFQFDRARIWSPVPFRGLRYGAAARLDAILEAAAGRAPYAGLGAAFRQTRSWSVAGRPPASDGVLDTAAPALLVLERWIADVVAGLAQTVAAPPEAANLVGLGPGLTPAGDDYLGGLMIGLHAMNRGDLVAGLARLVLPAARRRTNVISHAHLACAAEGQGGSALHWTIAAIAGSGSFDVGTCLDAIARTGATSGWDALAGAVLPIRIHLGIRVPMPESGSWHAGAIERLQGDKACRSEQKS